MAKGQVFKTTDYISVVVTDKGLSWNTNGISDWVSKQKYGAIMRIRGGWKNSNCLYNLTANSTRTTYINGETGKPLYSSSVPKWVDSGWNKLFSDSGLNINSYLQPHSIEVRVLKFFTKN